MDSSRGTDTFLTAISFWPLHNVDFVLVCWHLKTLILWFNWYSSAASTQYLAVLFDVGVIYYPLPGMEKLVHCDKMWEFTRQHITMVQLQMWDTSPSWSFLVPFSRPKVIVEQVWILTPSLGQEGPALTSITDHCVSNPDRKKLNFHNLITI